MCLISKFAKYNCLVIWDGENLTKKFPIGWNFWVKNYLSSKSSNRYVRSEPPPHFNSGDLEPKQDPWHLIVNLNQLSEYLKKLRTEKSILQLQMEQKQMNTH